MEIQNNNKKVTSSKTRRALALRSKQNRSSSSRYRQFLKSIFLPFSSKVGSVNGQIKLSSPRVSKCMFLMGDKASQI